MKRLFSNEPDKIRQKWLKELIHHYADWDGFIEVEELTPYQLRITRIRDGMAMDFYPKSCKGCWLGFRDPKYFIIPDIEQYLLNKFK